MTTAATELIGEVFNADTQTPDATTGELELPAWLRLECATVGRTAQTSAVTVRTGFGANAARAVSRDGSTWGLLLEPSMTNILDEQDLTAWSAVGATTAAAAMPDGVAGDVEVIDDSGLSQESLWYATVAVAAGDWCLSAWMQRIGAADSAARFDILGAGGTLQVESTADDATWLFKDSSATLTGGGSPSVDVIPRVTSSHTGNCRFAFLQIETGLYPTSFMGVDNATFTRAADVLRAEPDVIAPGGYFHMILRWRPHYADAEQAVDHNLIYFDANNRLFLRQSDSKIVLELGGVEMASSAITFSRYQELTLTIEHSADRRRLIVAGATTGNGTTDGTAVDAIALPPAAYVLGTSAGADEGAELAELSFPGLITFAEFAESRVLAQMSDAAGARNFRDLVRELAAGAGRYRDACFSVRNAFELSSATGDQLDKIGAIVGLPREGFTDARYRVFLGIQIELLLSVNRDAGEWAGTGANVLRICRTHVGGAAGTIVLTNYPPYSYVIQVPGLVLTEAELLARFLRTANYAGVTGLLIIIISSDSLWESNVSPITDGGVWESNVSPIAGASDWQIVVKT